jgi:hypothetical protein
LPVKRGLFLPNLNENSAVIIKQGLFSIGFFYTNIFYLEKRAIVPLKAIL